jgi:hypothetical protein
MFLLLLFCSVAGNAHDYFSVADPGGGGALVVVGDFYGDGQNVKLKTKNAKEWSLIIERRSMGFCLDMAFRFLLRGLPRRS